MVAPGVEPPSLRELRAMVGVLHHRGPDGHGLYRDARTALCHARLSIIDLSGGAQPMCNEDGSIWITFNGEIFNYRELRVELERAGHTFRTNCDTEIIVHAYEQWGTRAWRRFNGQFAFAIWDTRRGDLLLVRDPFGIPPLYYARTPSSIVFASEVKSIFAGGRVNIAFDPAGLVSIFTRWSAPAPQTAFAGIRSVPPGHTITINRNLEERIEAWWQPDFSAPESAGDRSLDDAADELEAILERAVALRLRADVPVGAYLSGGLDSSLTTSLIQRSDSSPLQTFSIRFEDPAFDETREQRVMVDHLKTTHHEVYVKADDIARTLAEVVRHCETPLLRTAPVPLYLLSGLVRDRGMKVVLTGEAADELFAGYSIFKEDKIRRFWARAPESDWRSALLSRVHHYVGSADQHEGRMWREFFRRGLTETDDPFYSHRIRWDNTAWGCRFLRRDFVEGIEPRDQETALLASLPDGWQSWTPLGRAQLLEIATFMSPYLLASQGDRVALAHGVEVRYPFLDPEVIAFASRLPGQMKLSGLKDKLVLRHLGKRHLPPAIYDRPKQPYRAPTSSALFGASSPEYVREMLSEASLDRHGLIETGPARLLASKAWARSGRMGGEREEMALVGMLTLQSLAHWLHDEFPAEVAAHVHRLTATRPSIMEDRITGELATMNEGMA